MSGLPNSKPSLLLDFANTRSLDPRVTFTRASSATHFNPQGLLVTAGNNRPRFDHNPATGESLGLLIEEARTNLLLRSEEFNDAYWTKIRTSITANTIVAPDGTLTGDKLVEDTSNNSRLIQSSNVSISDATAYVFSIYAKAGERSVLQLSVGSFIFGNFFVNFDLSNGTVSSISPSGITASITPVGNGWYRCVGVSTSIAAGSTYQAVWYVQNSPTAARGASYTGNGTSGIYLWGAQLEAGAFPTSYIPTTSAAATRAADVASMTGANFSSWYRQDEGTIFVRYAEGGLSGYTIANISDGTATNAIQIRRINSSNLRTTFTYSGATAFTLDHSIAQSVGNVLSRAVAYKSGDHASVLSGGAAVVNSNASNLFAATELNIGSGLSGTGPVGGHIRKLAYYPRRLANTELQELTK